MVAGTNLHFAPPVRRVGAWASTAMGDAVVPPSPAWPLYYDGDRRTRFAYAIFALNKVGLRALILAGCLMFIAARASGSPTSASCPGGVS